VSDEVQHVRMTIGQHLEELRWRLLKAICWVMVALFACLAVQEHLMTWALGPHKRVIAGLEQEVRYREAPQELRDDVHSAKESDKSLGERLAKFKRKELKLRESFETAGPALESLVEAQGKLKDRLTSLEDRLTALGDTPTAGQLAPITSERVAIAKEAAALHQRYEETALPFVDTLAKVPDARLMDYKYQGPFLSYLKLSFICALFLASPMVAHQMWGFVAVGLYPHEKKHINLFAPLSLFCFALGGVFGYFVLIPVGLYFLSTYAPPDMMAGTFALGEYLSLFMTLTVVVGLVFELPLVMSFLTLIGVMNSERYRKYRRYWWFAAVVIGALLTPPDPATQMLLAIPMVGLYEVGILISMFIRPSKPEEPEEEPAPVVAPPKPKPPSLPDDSSAKDATPEEVAPKVEPKPAKPAPEAPSAASLIKPVEQPRVARGEAPPEPEQPSAEEPSAEEPSAEEPSAEEPSTEEPSGPYEGEEEYEGEGDNDDPTLKYLYDEPEEEEEEPAPEEPAEEAEASPEDAEAPSGNEPASEEPASEEPASEEPASEEPASEEPASEEPASEEPASEEPEPNPDEEPEPNPDEEPSGPYEGEEEYEGEGDNDDPTLKYLYEEPEPPLDSAGGEGATPSEGPDTPSA
jgi:Tat protein translocase TatC